MCKSKRGRVNIGHGYVLFLAQVLQLTASTVEEEYFSYGMIKTEVTVHLGHT